VIVEQLELDLNILTSLYCFPWHCLRKVRVYKYHSKLLFWQVSWYLLSTQIHFPSDCFIIHKQLNGMLFKQYVEFTMAKRNDAVINIDNTGNIPVFRFTSGECLLNWQSDKTCFVDEHVCNARFHIKCHNIWTWEISRTFYLYLIFRLWGIVKILCVLRALQYKINALHVITCIL